MQANYLTTLAIVSALSVGFVAGCASPGTDAGTDSTTPAVETQVDPCASANPCATKDNPCASTNPCAAKDNPCASANPCAAAN